MPSYQDIETRLAVVEDKIDFVMKVFSLQAQLKSPIEGAPPKIVKQSMLQLYRQVKTAGIEPIEPPELVQTVEE